MSVTAGLDPLYAANSTFSDWLIATNNIITYIRNNVVTASNGSVSQTTSGDSILNGTYVANTLVAETALRGGTLGASANLNITSNTVHSSNVWINGVLDVANTGYVGNTQLYSYDFTTTSNNVTLEQFPLSQSHSFKYLIHAHDASNNSYCVEMLCVHNASAVTYTRYAELGTGSISVTITPSVVGANVVLTAVSNANAANQFVYKVFKTAMIP